jgi:hypothetical protein
MRTGTVIRFVQSAAEIVALLIVANALW